MATAQRVTPPRPITADRIAPETSSSSPPANNTTLPRALSPKSAHRPPSPRSSPRLLTGAAALADVRRAAQQYEAERAARQVSPNPNVLALNALMGTRDMSRPSDAPPTSQLSEPLKSAADKITVPTGNGQLSPRTRATNGTSSGKPSVEAGKLAMTVTASPTQTTAPQFVEEPESMDDAVNDDPQLDDTNRPFTYPGPASHLRQPPDDDDDSRRDLSYDSGKTGKRHKCPYCATEFTRHHNLKSHLLTHSQEKPYVCQTCQSRFRRLHDLKRHTKLHTGERPHVCPKCNRKFARGDALARHNKGPGGCANRKSSFGAGDEDDDAIDDTMDGLEYENEGADENPDEGELLDPQGRRVSEPNRKRPHPDSSPRDPRAPYRQQSSTYPPPMMTRAGESSTAMAPPPPTLLSPRSRPPGPEASSNPTSTHEHSPYPSPYYTQSAAGSFPAPHVTESPRPLSPRQDQHRLSVGDPQGLRNRSPSVNSNYQSPQYGRPSAGTAVPPNSHPSAGGHASQLPSLPSMTAHHVQPPQPVQPPSYPSQHHHPQTGSNPGSHSSHGPSSAGSIRDILGPDSQDVLGYVRNLEQRFSRMQDEYELRISRLQSDVIELKKQLQERR